MRNPMKSSSSYHRRTKAVPSTNRKDEKKRSKAKRLGTKENASLFDRVTDDLLLIIFTALAAAATSTADLFNAMLTSKRFQRIGSQPRVLKSASLPSLYLRANNWSRGAENFLIACAAAGNDEAAYLLGMIYYYCLENRQEGRILIHRAALQLNPSAVHALSIMELNGSPDPFPRREKNVSTGIALCRLASDLGHVDASRELGHFFASGYGVMKDLKEGRRFLYKASATARAEFDFLRSSFSSRKDSLHHLSFNSSAVLLYRHLTGYNRRKTRGRAQNLPSPKLYPSNQFLLDWFKNRPLHRPLRLCSNEVCGLPETRRKEFHRCSVCKTVQYCSRACAGVDWYLRHNYKCEAPEWGGRPDQYQIDSEEDLTEDEDDQYQTEDDLSEDEGEEAEYRLVIRD